MRMIIVGVIATLLSVPIIVRAQDDVADVPSQDLRVAGNEQQHYFLIGVKDGQKAPEKGYGLLLILPGGDGSADFNPFIKRIWQNALPQGYLVAQLVAVPSNNQNQIVWPTAKSHDPKQKFTSEDFIAGVIKEVAAKHKIDDSKIFALGWSSGGPAVYAATLMKGSLIKGAFIAMSVFFPNQLPPLAGAKDKPIFLLQSPDDQVTKYLFAKNAEKQLKVAGAKVKLMDYPGGHGWQGDVFGNIQAGMEWLEKGGASEAKP
jgi:predicted esterase